MIRRPHVPVFTRSLITSLVLAVAAGPWHAGPALGEGPGPGQTQAEYDTRVRESKARARELLSQGARRRIEAARRWRAAVREARRRGLPAPTPGTRQRPAPLDEDRAAGRPGTTVTPQARPLGASGATTIPTNVRVNNPAGDAANTTQAEQAIAVWGNNVLVAWNDGLGPQYQGYGVSTDGGVTFTDRGAPLGLAGWTWVSDPSVTVNEKTGKFYYCGLIDVAPASNGIGIVSGSFSGNTFNWDTPVLVRSVTTASALLDKQWLVADSTNGNLYLTYSTFDASNHIDFQRSTDGGAHWSPAVQLSAPGDNGAVQGSRPVVGPGGVLYATWSAIGSSAQDFIRIRKSTTMGNSWVPGEITPASVFLNFGTGAPGFNRERGVDFPSIAVDRTTGTNRGRVYLAWTESVNKYDDPLNTLGNLVETENNDFFNRADPFTPGQRLRGSLGTTTDFDYWSFSAIQGTDYVFECDSVPNPLYTFRVFCGQDTNVFAGAGARLAFSGDPTAPAGGTGFIIWTAPTTGTYYLRMAYLDLPGSAIGGYRISTGIAGVGSERARDSRDVFVSSSVDGANWTAPVRVNDAAPTYDEWLPEVTVGADGMPYVSWFDWRDDGCGGRSYQYIARSSDGGATWSANQRFSDVQNDWTTISSNLAPNQGDYSHMYADPRYVRVAWADGRGGSPDVFTTRIDTWSQLSSCQGDLADSAGHTINPSWTVTNLSPLFANTFNYRLTSQRNWPLPAPSSITLAAEASGPPINLSVAVPDTAAPGVNRLCLVVTSSQGASPQSCCFNLTVQSLGGPPPPPPPPAFDLGPSVPNPATDLTTFDFSLPQAGPVKLRIFDVRGELVRTLDRDGVAGANTATWDGRDDHGRLVRAGAYFYKLEAFGRSQTRRLVWLK